MDSLVPTNGGSPEELVLPAYEGACISNIVPALLDPSNPWPSWMPEVAAHANQVVLLVLDGIGWTQFQARKHLAPTMSTMLGSAITSVAPTTTATALTSISTGATPGLHGIMGYRMAIGREVLNVLRWSATGRDARKTILPESVQILDAFEGQRPPVITRSEFRESGFTRAHLDKTRLIGWRVSSTLVAEIESLLNRNEPFVYAYYDGIDKIAHEFGLGVHYDTEFSFVDRLVSDVINVLPPGAVLIVTSDHGQVDVGDDVITPDPAVLAHVDMQSGEGRFRWLHARPGHARALYDDASACHSDRSWVVSVDQVIDEGWFGPVVTDEARSRLGDVALVARESLAFADSADSGAFPLRSRHGSLTADEMYVPLFVGTR
ncbi:MAG: alkaline phosphatase family protein [Acidimicrobiales bacterium]